MKRGLKKIRIVIGVLLILLICTNLISSIFIINGNCTEKTNEVKHDINNVEDVKEFMDNYFNDKMQDYCVPGASIIVVKDNEEIFKSGYGYSNLEEKILVDPEKTLFPACSVSKLYTATAIIKLYEEGKIDLDKDVNVYISPYKIDNKFNEPVTCRNLLTHTSGLDEESELNVSTINYNELKTQEYYFDTHPLKVIVEPNTICRYSNIGYNLLGFIIEKVSGISYEDFIKEKILKPLKMDRALVRESNSEIAIGYQYDDKKYEKAPFSFQYTSGSSGIICTAEDMKKFIIANLNKDNSILSTENFNMMHKKQFSNSEVLLGMGFGFIKSNRNNKEIIKHEGGLPGYTTTLFLIPQENLGIYIATNSLNALPFNFEEEFLNYFYPYENNEFSKAKKDTNKSYSKYEGSYRGYDGISKTSIMKMAALFDLDIRIEDNKDGSLTLHECTQAKEEITTKLIEINNGVFLREDNRGYFCFKFDDKGNVTYAFNDVSINSYEKVNFYESSEFILAIICFFIIIFIINLLRFFVCVFQKKNKKLSIYNKIFNLSNLIIELFGLFGGLIAAGSTLWMCLNSEFSLKYLLYIGLTLTNICAVLSVIILMYSIYKIIKGKLKVHYLVLNIANLAFVWVLYYLNFIGYKLY